MKKFNLLIATISMLASSLAFAGTLYTIDEQSNPTASLYTLDPANGAATLIGEIDPAGDFGPSLTGGAYDSLNDKLLFTTIYSDIAGEYGLIDTDRLTGLSTFIGEHGSSNVFSTAYDSLNDVLYAFDYDKDQSLATIDRATGLTTAIGSTGGVRIDGMAYDSADDTLYGVGTTNLYSLNRATGLATVIGPHGVSAGSNTGLAVDPDTGIMYMTESQAGGLYTIAMDTGVATLVGITGLSEPSSLAIIPDGAGAGESIPVPTLGIPGLLLLVGLFMWVGFRFRQQAQA